MKLCFFLIACLCSCSFEIIAQTQHVKNGKTVDSQTFEPVAFVAVQSVLTKSVVITNEKGEFSVSCVIGDSLIFSRLGYAIKRLSIDTLNMPMVIVLSETQTMLPTISVYGDFKPKGKER